MIDINVYLNKTYEVKLNNRLLHVYEPTNAMYVECIQRENTDETVDKFAEFQCQKVSEFLSRNTEKVKVTKQEIEKLPRSAVVEVYKVLLLIAYTAVKDPN